MKPDVETQQEEQNTDTLLMVSPNGFKYNKQTSKSNIFQQEVDISNDIALREFNTMVDVLRKNKIRVIVMPSRTDVETPDSVFPDWFSTHASKNAENRILVLYSMFTENRRNEIQVENLERLLRNKGIYIDEIIDLSSYANQKMFLEGTGSLVLDRENKIVYAAISPRTNETLVNIFSEKMKYKPIIYRSFDEYNRSIYHTDITISIGSKFAVVALDSVTNSQERAKLIEQLNESKKEIIATTLEQMKNMTGNIVEVKSVDGKGKIIMSRTAYNAFTLKQRDCLSKYGELIPVDIPNIETVGGGSARCMLGEIF